MLRTGISLAVLVLLLIGSLWIVYQVDQLDEAAPVLGIRERTAQARTVNPSPAAGRPIEPREGPAMRSAEREREAAAPPPSIVKGATPGGAVLAGTVRVSGEDGPVPLSGAAVELVIDGAGTLSATTDSDGRFRFEDLTTGGAALSARALHEPESDPQFFSLEPNARIEDVVIDLVSGVRVEGEVLENIPNRAGRRVVARQVEGLDRWTADVDDTGRFTLFLAPGTYRIFLDWAPDTGAPDDFVVAYAERAEKVVEVRPGRVMRITLGDEPPDAVHVQGRVLAGDRPEAGLVVHVLPESGTRPITMARTGPDGSFRVVLPAPGSVRFAVGEDPSTQVLFPREIAGGDNAGLELRLPTASLSGRVLAPDGSGAAGRSVLLTPTEEPVGSRRLGVVRRTVSDDAGNWRIAHLRAGTYRLRLGGIGVVDPDDGLGVRILRDVVLTDGEQREGLRVTLPVAAEVRVQVTDRSGAPLPDVLVFARDPNGIDERIWAPEVRTGSDGWATLGGLGTGRVTILAVLGDRRARARTALSAGDRTEVRITLP